MAAPNIVNVTTITAKTAYLTPSNNTENVLLANPANSGKVFKINNITAANLDASGAYSATVGINTVADGSGTSYYMINAVPVPLNASIIVMDKSAGVYLEEDKSLVVKSSAASKITYIISYEEIS